MVCHKDLATGESVICTACLYHIPKTRYWFDPENPVAKIFWGRVLVENACSFFFFSKGSRYRKLLHHLKYNGKKEVGFVLGKEFGFELKKVDLYKKIDFIIPVPLHPKRLKTRGYNQAEEIAKGLNESMGIPLSTNNLIRPGYTETQTRKTREERSKNVSKAFKLDFPELLAGKHILLVDDVVTTGATLEECASTILEAAGSRVSIVTLAYA
ncbi:MAG: ComF family protein [Tenuifilaceae bacterium]